MFLRSLILCALLPLPALADCLTAEDTASFETTAKLKAGDEWRLAFGDEGGQQSEYRDRYGEPLRWQMFHHGVYPAFEQQSVTVDPASRNQTPFPELEWEMQTVFDSDPPAPEAGGAWSGKGRAEGRIGGVGKSWAFSASYRFDAEKMVTLSGCTYRSFGVNGEFQSDKDRWTGRWVYFPDLNLGIQTRGTDSRTGEDWANGMVGLE